MNLICVNLISNLHCDAQAHAELLAAEASWLEQLLDRTWQQLQAALHAAGLELRDEEEADDIGSDQAD